MANGKPGAPIGNKNGSKNKPWTRALERASHQNPDAMRRIAEKVLKMAEEGDIAAIKELGDRLDGKPSQDHNVAGAVTVQITPTDAGL